MPFDKYNVGCYLLDRLSEVGVQDMFGVPGDFNLRFLDDVMTHSIKWIGTANELNASYAADGYARCRGIGCLVTTYGVGELSAANGIAGAYAESVPVIHIVGVPSYAQMNKRLILHHSLGDGDFLHYLRVSKELCCAAEMLTPENARHQIDKVITEVLYHKKPGYIGLPMDVAEMAIEAPTARLIPRLPLFSECSLDKFEAAASAIINKSKSGGVLIGHLVDRYNLISQMNTFLQVTGLPFAVGALGKGAANESFPNFVGTYLPGGEKLSPGAAVVEKSDFAIVVGLEHTDLVTAGFQQKFSENTIHVNPFDATIGGQLFTQLPMYKAIAVLQTLCCAAKKNLTENQFPAPESFKPVTSDSAYSLNHMWNEIQQSLRPGDIVLGDMGTSSFSATLLRLPAHAIYVAQNMYGSIGYTMPAALGCQAAFPDRRVICIIGDGGAQMTVQDIGTVAREKLKVQYVLVNNDGYTIERYIRGMEAHYNDITRWNWTGLAKNLCRDNEPETHRVQKEGELSKYLQESPKNMQLIEVIVPRLDGPLRCPVPLPLMKKE